MAATLIEKHVCLACLISGLIVEMEPIDPTGAAQHRECATCGSHLFIVAHEYEQTPE